MMNKKPTLMKLSKTTARWLKTIGALLLLGSFMAQNYVYDAWEEENDNYLLVNMNHSDMQRSSLLYQILYYTVDEPDSTFQRFARHELILGAADEMATGYCLQIIGSEKPKEERTNRCNQVLQAAKKVFDYNSLTQFAAYAQERADMSVPKEWERVKTMGGNADVWKHVFLLLYIVGTLLYLVGAHRD